MAGIIAIMLICLGVITFILAKKVVFMRDRCKKSGYIVIPCSAKTKNLEKIVKAYYWEEIFENENLAREILLVLMDKSENTFTAKRLAQQYVMVTVVDITGLEDYLKKHECSCRKC